MISPGANKLRKIMLYAEELARCNEALKDFAAISSHDLQAPFRKIIAFGLSISEAIIVLTLNPDPEVESYA